MSRMKWYYEEQHPAEFCVYVGKSRYGFFNFIFDLIMTFFTCGLWLIWVIVRQSRNR